jgi:hypothetical protein
VSLHREPSSSSTMWLSGWDRILMARFASAAQCRGPIGYFCPDGTCAFEFLGLGLLAS